MAEEKYKSKAATRAVGVIEKSLRDWHKKVALPPQATQAGRDGETRPNKTTAYFAKESQMHVHHFNWYGITGV